MSMSAQFNKFHSLELVPEGKKIGDVAPAYAGIEKEVRIGKTSKVCASCRKPFSAVRKARKEIRLHAVDLELPIAWTYPLCGACVARYQRGAHDRDAVLAAVEAFHLGERPTQ
jgi:hypothetical protein